MRRRRAVCASLVMAVCAVTAGGCSDGDGEDGGLRPGPAAASASRGPSAGTSPSPSATAPVATDPAKLPRTGAAARALIRTVIADPALFGQDVVKGTPYESDPDRWPVLGEDCVWRQQPRPDDVLATLTRHYEVPANQDQGTARLTSVVTVHRTARQADWENAGMLEEMLRCPEQRLGAGERITGITSSAAYFGDAQNDYADDVLTESGDHHGRGTGTAPYSWTQSRLGQVTVSVSVKAGRGYGTAEARDLVRGAGILMLRRLKDAIGRDQPDTRDRPAGGDDAKDDGA